MTSQTKFLILRYCMKSSAKKFSLLLMLLLGKPIARKAKSKNISFISMHWSAIRFFGELLPPLHRPQPSPLLSRAKVWIDQKGFLFFHVLCNSSYANRSTLYPRRSVSQCTAVGGQSFGLA